jgi:hypothetical protein
LSQNKLNNDQIDYYNNQSCIYLYNLEEGQYVHIITVHNDIDLAKNGKMYLLRCKLWYSQNLRFGVTQSIISTIAECENIKINYQLRISDILYILKRINISLLLMHETK